MDTNEYSPTPAVEPHPKTIKSLYQSIALILLFIGIGVAMTVAAVVAKQKSSGAELELKSSCVYNLIEYPHGSVFPDADNCNTCVCDDGVFSCTKKLCANDTTGDEQLTPDIN